jgi:hypothetical protein
MKKSGILCLLIVLATGAFCQAAMQVETSEPNRQYRFYVGSDKDFLGQAFDWSGVGQTSSGHWATMISSDYFVSAAHYHPTAGETLTFYEGNDTSTSYTATVSTTYYQISYNGVLTDLWLGKLTTSIPASANITSYPILDLASDDDYVGLTIYVNGKPNTIGRNVIDRITEADEGTPAYKSTVSMEYDYDTVGGLGADECYLISGDSGGPSFVDVNGQLALVGIHYYNGGTPNPEDIGMISGDSFVPYYIDQLNANMDGASVAVVTPEPGTLVLLLVVLLPAAWPAARRALAKAI